MAGTKKNVQISEENGLLPPPIFMESRFQVILTKLLTSTCTFPLATSPYHNPTTCTSYKEWNI